MVRNAPDGTGDSRMLETTEGALHWCRKLAYAMRGTASETEETTGKVEVPVEEIRLWLCWLADIAEFIEAVQWVYDEEDRKRREEQKS